MQFCTGTIRCENKLEITDEECCGAEGQFCPKTERCESKASYLQDCGGYLVDIMRVYSYSWYPRLPPWSEVLQPDRGVPA